MYVSGIIVVPDDDRTGGPDTETPLFVCHISCGYTVERELHSRKMMLALRQEKLRNTPSYLRSSQGVGEQPPSSQGRAELEAEGQKGGGAPDESTSSTQRRRRSTSLIGSLTSSGSLLKGGCVGSLRTPNLQLLDRVVSCRRVCETHSPITPGDGNVTFFSSVDLFKVSHCPPCGYDLVQKLEEKAVDEQCQAAPLVV